jgi:Tfp pilus assembly protein PilO
MKFSKLPKEKRNQLIAVVLGTVAVLAALGYGLIKLQQDRLGAFADKKSAAELQLRKMEDAIKRRDAVNADFAAVSQTLTNKESGMPPTRDEYSWMISTLRRFKANYKIEIPQFSPVSTPADCNLIPKFPYKQVTLSIGGTGYYHDVGRFVADFENTFPLMRIVNLSLELNPTPAAGEREKLSFRMDIVALVKAAQP